MQVEEVFDACNSKSRQNLKKIKNVLQNIQILIPKLKFKFWRKLDIFINYNNVLAFQNLLLKFQENYKILNFVRINQNISK